MIGQSRRRGRIKGQRSWPDFWFGLLLSRGVERKRDYMSNGSGEFVFGCVTFDMTMEHPSGNGWVCLKSRLRWKLCRPQDFGKPDLPGGLVGWPCNNRWGLLESQSKVKRDIQLWFKNWSKKKRYILSTTWFISQIILWFISGTHPVFCGNRPSKNRMIKLNVLPLCNGSRHRK